jgi:phosphotriesterase-related protein
MHEHIFHLDADVRHNYPHLSWSGSREARIADAADRLQQLLDRGISTIVDLTVLGNGRNVPDVQKVNELVDMNVIVATGIYTWDALPMFIATRPFDRKTAPSDANDVMVEMFVHDIMVGIGDTGVRAGVLKCCTDEPGVTANIDRVLRAVARAHRITGAPISTHTRARLQNGRDQQRIFREEGVDLSRVVIGHSGDTTDLDYLQELMDAGSTIGMDRFGFYRADMTNFEQRVDTVARLCELGYSDRMVLSHDSCCFIDHGHLQQDLPDWHLNHIPDRVLPALLDAGVTETQLTQMLTDNPARVFSSNTPY